jgi:hypothetical protein
MFGTNLVFSYQNRSIKITSLSELEHFCVRFSLGFVILELLCTFWMKEGMHLQVKNQKR